MLAIFPAWGFALSRGAMITITLTGAMFAEGTQTHGSYVFNPSTRVPPRSFGVALTVTVLTALVF